MLEGEKKWEGAVVIGGDNLPSPSWNRVNWSAKYWGASGPPGPPGSGTTELLGVPTKVCMFWNPFFRFLLPLVEFLLYLVVLDFGHSLFGRLLLFLDCFWDWRYSKFYQHWRPKFHCSVKRYVFFNFTLFGTGRGHHSVPVRHKRAKHCQSF